MINLSRSDWAEVYNALLSKSTSPAVGDDKKWKAKLSSIMRRIGPDGERAFNNGVRQKRDKWTIVLLLPDTHTDNYGQDTAVYQIKNDSMTRAVDIARFKLKQRLKDPDLDVDNIFVISVFSGEHEDKVGKWRKKQS